MRLAHAMKGTFSYMRYSYHGNFMIPTYIPTMPFIFFEEALFSEVLRKAYILVSIVHLGRS